MPRRLLPFLLVLLAATPLAADGAILPTLGTPTDLAPLELELRFLHRFVGDLLDRPLETVLGATEGANAGFGFRFSPLQGLDLKATGATGERELSAGASCALAIPGIPLSLQAEALGFYQSGAGGLFAALSAQTQPLAGIFSPALSVSFDSQHIYIGLAAGLVVDIGPTFSLFGEIYPLLPQSFTDTTGMGTLMAFVTGIKLRTGGHQFMILVSNSDSVSQRLLAAGAFPTGLHLGFNIIRRFWF